MDARSQRYQKAKAKYLPLRAAVEAAVARRDALVQAAGPRPKPRRAAEIAEASEAVRAAAEAAGKAKLAMEKVLGETRP